MLSMLTITIIMIISIHLRNAFWAICYFIVFLGQYRMLGITINTASEKYGMQTVQLFYVQRRRYKVNQH